MTKRTHLREASKDRGPFAQSVEVPWSICAKRQGTLAHFQLQSGATLKRMLNITKRTQLRKTSRVRGLFVGGPPRRVLICPSLRDAHLSTPFHGGGLRTASAQDDYNILAFRRAEPFSGSAINFDLL